MDSAFSHAFEVVKELRLPPATEITLYKEEQEKSTNPLVLSTLRTRRLNELWKTTKPKVIELKRNQKALKVLRLFSNSLSTGSCCSVRTACF
jgi:hypothetical protein